MKRLLILLILVSIMPLLSARAAVAVDDARAAAAGIRKLPGKRLTLYTDLAGPEIDRLPAIFEQALPQWCRYFGVKEDKLADWHVTGCLMKNKSRFAAAGLLPNDLPPFPNGYSRGKMLWLFEQPSDFYRRELLLHEGTHCFMFTAMHSNTPPWYSEGMAEYLGTHRWQDGRLTMGHMPRSHAEVPEWGRIGIIQRAMAEGRPLGLEELLTILVAEALHAH